MAGISATTPNNLVIAPGAYVTVAGTDMGALMNEIVYRVRRATYHPKLFGAKGFIKGTGHDNEAVPELVFTMTEFEYSLLSEAMDRLGNSSDANSEWHGAGTIGKIADADYPVVKVLGTTRHDGKAIHIVLDQAFISNDPEVTLSDEEDSTLEVVFTGVYAAASATTFPAKFAAEV